MANSAHFIPARAGQAPVLTVRDDRGSPITVLELPESVNTPRQAEDELAAAGWSRSDSVEWTEADDGWVVPVLQA